MDRRRYFDIMGAAPTAVTIVTTVDATEGSGGGSFVPADGDDAEAALSRPVGLTVSAVTSVSAEPPILAICLDVRSRTLPIVVRAGRFAVNFLRGDRAELAARFAAPIADRFAGVGWCSGVLGVPILVDDALAYAECLVGGRFAIGDHVVVLGRVVDGAPPPPGSRPLMYFRHGFSAWAGPVEDARNGASGGTGEGTSGATGETSEGGAEATAQVPDVRPERPARSSGDRVVGLSTVRTGAVSRDGPIDSFGHRHDRLSG